MKKLISTLLIMFVMTAFTSVTYADDVDETIHWKGDKQFPRIFARRMRSFYLDRTSMVVKENNSPYYVIAVNVFSADNSPAYPNPSDDILHVWTFEFRYDTDKMVMYLKTTGDGLTDSWSYISPLTPDQQSTREQCMAMNAGEALWYIFKGNKFYGSRMWKDEQTGELREMANYIHYDIL